MEEQLILKEIKNSNIQSYEWLIDQYTSYVVRVIMKVANRQLTIEEVEELSADVFIGIWEKRARLQIETGKLRAYLAAMARNKTINKLKAKGKVELIPLEEDYIDYETPESELLRQEDKELINKALMILPQPDKEIFIRRYFYMEKIIDIAEELGLNVQTVGTKLFRGKKRLEKALRERGVTYE